MNHETIILSGLFHHPKLIREIDLSVANFSNNTNRTIYESMCDMDADGIEFDVGIIWERLQNQGFEDKNYLFDIAAIDPVPSSIPFHVKELKEAKAKKELNVQLTNILKDLNANQVPLSDILERLRLTTADYVDYRTGEDKVSHLVREWVLTTPDIFFTTDLYSRLRLTTRQEQKAVISCLQRMQKQGLIAKEGLKRGCYRTIDRSYKFKDYKKAEFNDLEIRLPFGFEKYVDILPGDIITFSGWRNVGKTALAFECIYLNQKRFKVYYFSREIREHGLNKRLRKHKDLGINDWTFEFASDIPNFVDILQENAINIIDYVEVKDGEYYKMASILADIHDGLKDKGTAIAIVMLQKKKESKYAMGGEGTEIKPAITFNVDPNYPDGAILTAIKVKNRKDEENPEGYQMKFKIVRGINLIPQGVWQPEV